MKFLTFYMFDVAKMAEVAKAADNVADTPGQKILAQYIFQTPPFEGLPPNTAVSFNIAEVESNEAIATADYPMLLAGVSRVLRVPILEVPVRTGVKAEKKYRG